MRIAHTSKRKHIQDMEECKGIVHLGKGWRNKYSMVTRSEVSEKKLRVINGKLY